MLVLMALVAAGIGRLINPLLLFALITLCFIVLGVREWRVEGDEPEDAERQGPAPADPRENPAHQEPENGRTGEEG